MDFGVGSLAYDTVPEGTKAKPKEIVGLTKVEESFKTAGDDFQKFLAQIGNICDFIFRLMNDIQRKLEKPLLAPNKKRYEQFAKPLSEKLYADTSKIETVTLAAKQVYPTVEPNPEHQDKLNPTTTYVYSKTGCLDVAIEDSYGALWTFQVLANWRKSVDDYVFPYLPAVLAVVSHFQNYLKLLQNDYDNYMNKYEGRYLPKSRLMPFDRTAFFINDDFEYEQINIAHSSMEPVYLSVLKLMIGPSRVFSLSMQLQVINDCRFLLKFDQRLELLMIISLLNTPVRAYYCLNKLNSKANDATDQFQFQTHPWYDFEEICREELGKIQGGPCPRYSPFGIDLSDLFGSNQCTDTEKMKGIEKLVQLCRIGYEMVKWINSIEGKEIEMMDVQKNITIFGEEIQKNVGCEYGHFRMQVFITGLIGTAMVTKGPHL